MSDTANALPNLIARGDHDGLRAALAGDADPNWRDRWGVSALAQAAARGDLDAVRLLLEHGADPGLTSDAGNSPLMAAAARGHVEVMRLLLDRGADPEARNKWGLGAEDWARWPANSAEAQALLRARGQ